MNDLGTSLTRHCTGLLLPSAEQQGMLSKMTLFEIGRNLLAKLPTSDITLIPLQAEVTQEHLRSLFPQGRIVACDFAIQDQELGQLVVGGLLKDDILNVDHHAEIAGMMRRVSSGNLAIDVVNQDGPVPLDIPVVIHHTDCDSIITSSVLRGLIPPHPIFGEAVLAADHTGEELPIADLLQALDVKRDINFSLRNLAYLLCGEEVELEAAQLLSVRTKERRIAKEVLDSNTYDEIGAVVLVTTEKRVSGEFLPALFPNAAVIVGGSKWLSDDPEEKKWEIKLRMGNAAPDGMNLFTLGVKKDIDPHFGGRWNAGSNKRSGGTTTDPHTYARRLNQNVEKLLASTPRPIVS